MLLSGINPGSDERALNVADALEAIELLRESECAILGGDIITMENDSLIYAYQCWGDDYQFLNWYCSRKNDENDKEFSERSYQSALEGIDNANHVAKHLGYDCWIVLIF